MGHGIQSSKGRDWSLQNYESKTLAMQVLEQSQLGERTSSWNARCSTISGNDRVAKTEIKALEMRSQGTWASAALTSSNKMTELGRKSSESVTRVLNWERQGWSSQMAAIITGRNRITGSSKRNKEDLNLTSTVSIGERKVASISRSGWSQT